MDSKTKKDLLWKLLGYAIGAIIVFLEIKNIVSESLFQMVFEKIRIVHLGYNVIGGFLCTIFGLFLIFCLIFNSNNKKKEEVNFRVINWKGKEYRFEKIIYEKISLFGIAFALFIILCGISSSLYGLDKDTDIFIPTYVNDMIWGCVGIVVSMMIWYIGYKMNNCISGRLTDLQPLNAKCILSKKKDKRKRAKYENLYGYCIETTFYVHIEDIRCKEINVPKSDSTKIIYYCSKKKVTITKEEFVRARKVKRFAILLFVISVFYVLNIVCKNFLLS